MAHDKARFCGFRHGPTSHGANRVYGGVQACAMPWAAASSGVEPSDASDASGTSGIDHHAQGLARLCAEQRGTADRSRWTADPDRWTGALLAARDDPCHECSLIVYKVNRFY